MNDTIRRFKMELERDARDYRYVERPGAGHAHIQFTGTFQGNEVIWDAVIVTLAQDYRERYPGGEHPGAEFSLPQFIEVGAATDAMRQLKAGLNVPRIDEATLRKTIIMIRNYKRLHLGRHEFEPAWKPA
ncbi:MAG: hypothetical protein OEM43_07745 [Gammaproteobacteria bacterium]|nr:hypothetical protein [Gammaproteobacteria bacterium]